MKIILLKIFNRARRLFAKLYFTKTRFCCVCNNYIGHFLPYRNGFKSVPKSIVALDVIGSDVENFSCPNCLCHDRERHIYLYLLKNKILDQFSVSKVLHFAPELNLSRIITSYHPVEYVQADLMPTSDNVKEVNIQDIPFPDNYFDFVIANHVLEHVDDDIKALSELYRVLKVGGAAILQTPFSDKLEFTFKDSGINDDFSRLQIYGQEDHVRLYGKDIADRFESVGFLAAIKTHEYNLNEYDFEKYGVNKKEVFLFFLKR